MKPVKVIYQKKSDSPCRTTKKKIIRSNSPAFMNNYSSKFFQIQTNTQMFHKTYMNALTSQVILSQPQENKSRPKRRVVSYIPSSSLYKKLNAKLALNTLEFDSQVPKAQRPSTKSSFRHTIDYTNNRRNSVNLFPLEARGSSLINDFNY